MSASELLFVIVRETGAANALVAKLAEHAGTHEVVLVHEVRQLANELDGHLRAASCAATALRGIANGQDEPRQG
jgi:hypothetical protein